MKDQNTQKQFQTKLSEDEQLSMLISRLPCVKLSVNFTKQVLSQTVKATQPAPNVLSVGKFPGFLRFRHWWQMAASFVLLCTITCLIYLQYNQNQSRMQQMAQSLSVVAETAERVATIDESDLTAISMMGESDEEELDGDLWVAMVSN